MRALYRGWFGGGACPDVPRDGDVITGQDLEAYTAALAKWLAAKLTDYWKA